MGYNHKGGIWGRVGWSIVRSGGFRGELGGI